MNRGWVCLIAAALLAPFSAARAGGLRTTFGEVVVRKLKIGQTYSLYKLVNLPLRVVNTDSESADLQIEEVPVTAKELVQGYAPLPSLDWLRVENSTFTVAPNHEAVTDLIVSIPNDTSLLGRRFQADIWSHTVGARAMLVGLKSRLLIQIDSTPPTDEELKKKYVIANLANLDFTVLPVNGSVSDAPLGRDMDLRKEKKISIKLINPNDPPLNFRVRSIPVWESVIQPPPGYVQADNPNWLKPDLDVVKVEGNSIAETSLTLNIPDVDGTRNMHFFFIVSFELLEQQIPARVYYRLMVDTGPGNQKASPAGK
jgi:hypothetical protein